MNLLRPDIFQPFDNIKAALSLAEKGAPLASDSEDQAQTDESRLRLAYTVAEELGFKKVALPRQIHSATVHVVSEGYAMRDGDAAVTSQPGWMLGVTVADCVPVLLYDERTGSIGAIHSGWRGTLQNVAGETIATMQKTFGTQPADVYAWIGPAAAWESYEVGYDVALQFNQNYLKAQSDGKYLFDNKGAVRDQLLAADLTTERIAVDPGDTITDERFHSARREGSGYGRMFAGIGLAG